MGLAPFCAPLVASSDLVGRRDGADVQGHRLLANATTFTLDPGSRRLKVQEWPGWAGVDFELIA
ncbi:hypothetical protein BH23ACT4_BH23ACT4_02820 [soil metagenome]